MPFRNARITTSAQNVPQEDSVNLGQSRSYTLSLSPQLLYAQSALLPVLVTSRVHTQLEFQAVGSWWIYQHDDSIKANESVLQDSEDAENGHFDMFKKIPSSREDVFSDNTISTRDKRALMKFLRFVLQEETDAVESSKEGSSEESLADVLSSQFNISATPQEPLLALSLSHHSARSTNSQQAVQRIRRHLRSIGTFGPGFGAVIAKYGGGAEIAQVGCRAGAVGGGVYVLGRGIDNIKVIKSDSEAPESFGKANELAVELSDGDTVLTEFVVGSVEDLPKGLMICSTTDSAPMVLPTQSSDNSATDYGRSVRSISIVSSPLSHLFPPTSENGPIPAGAVVVFGRSGEVEGSSLNTANTAEPPIYLLVHSSESGECPMGQCELA